MSEENEQQPEEMKSDDDFVARRPNDNYLDADNELNADITAHDIGDLRTPASNWPELLPMPQEVRDEILTDEELEGCSKFITGLVKMKVEGQEHVPPLIMVVTSLPPDALEHAKDALCDQEGLLRWQFDQVMEERGGVFMPLAMIHADIDSWNEDRFQWMYEQGRDWVNRFGPGGARPRAICIAAEMHYSLPDPDRPKEREFQTQEEGFMVAIQTLDGRQNIRMCPIDREMDGNTMIIGPPVTFDEHIRYIRSLLDESYVPDKNDRHLSRNALAISFWRGYFFGMMFHLGFIDHNGKPIRKQLESDEPESE